MILKKIKIEFSQGYRFLLIFSLSISLAIPLKSIIIKGVILNKINAQPVEYVNIGIPGKNTGTVSDLNGNFFLEVDENLKNDSLLISCIGYQPELIKISDFLNRPILQIFLTEKTYDLKQIDVRFREFREKTLGVTSKTKSMQAGFSNNLLGYECGILMRTKNRTLIRKVRINIARCDYDSIFYRLNIYKPVGKNNFENILTQPVYIKLQKKDIKETIEINLEDKNIYINENFLVTLEHVKNMGDGNLYFCAGMMRKTYFRKTSQGIWETVPIGISISVLADVEK